MPAFSIALSTTQTEVKTIIQSFLTTEHFIIIVCIAFFIVIALGLILCFNKKKEGELEEMRRRLSLALEAGSLSAWMYDVKSKMFTSLYNPTLSEKGLGFNDFAADVHPQDRDDYYELFTCLISGVQKKGTQTLRFKRNGAYEWYQTHAIALLSETTGKVHHIIGTEKNITEEVVRQRELEENKSKLEMAFNAAEIVPWEFDVETRKFASPNANITMYNALPFDKLISYTSEEDKELLKNEMDTLIRGEKEKINFQVGITFPSKEQHWYTLHATVSERDNSGNVTKIIGISRDITQLKMTDELIQLRIKAEESNRLKSAFLANMSHEIRTPLNAIVGFSNLLYESDNKEERAQYMEIIEMNNVLLLQLISDILDISKIEAGELNFNYMQVDISHVLTSLYCIYKEKVSKGVELICELPDNSCTIEMDQNRLTQIIANFLSNACKFTSSGYIKMGYTYIDTGLRFYVKDTGKGIASKNIPNVFHRFAKFDQFTQGTGLGLSICKSLVDHLHGEIGFNSKEGKGSEFWFTIPCDPQIILNPSDKEAV